jgi:hypothetical protein
MPFDLSDDEMTMPRRRFPSEMGLKGRWLFMALLGVAIVALAGCATLSEPCGGFFVCAGWH